MEIDNSIPIAESVEEDSLVDNQLGALGDEATEEVINEPQGEEEKEENISINFPIATIKALAKEAASDARFSQDALAALSRACGVFLLYASLAAQDTTRAKKKSLMQPEHVILALAEVGFPEIAEECKTAMNKN